MNSKIRNFVESDRDFVTKSLLFSFMNGSKEIQKINRDSYMQAHNKTVNKLLDRCDCLIVCDPEQADLIYGFVIYENLSKFDIIHYMYARKDFRKHGFIKQCLEQIHKTENLALSHLTDEFKPARLKTLWTRVTYDPYTRI